jgi:hypothetical protein
MRIVRNSQVVISMPAPVFARFSSVSASRRRPTRRDTAVGVGGRRLNCNEPNSYKLFPTSVTSVEVAEENKDPNDKNLRVAILPNLLQNTYDHS